MAGAFDLSAWLDAWREPLATFLELRVADTWPEAFGEPLVYPLRSGGKRVRPALCIAAWRALAEDPEDLAEILPAAAAVELVHTYSLVHDDLPAMDDDDERRGKPTVHVAYDEPTAILVGDALLTEAFATLAEAPWPAPTTVELVRLLAEAAGHRGMVGGQASDIGLAGPVLDEETLRRLHSRKTGALITWSCLAGGIVAGADSAQREALHAYGQRVGLAFQLVDDLLDAEEDAGESGPPSFVRLLGEEATARQARLLIDEALQAIAPFDRPEALSSLAQFVVERDH